MVAILEVHAYDKKSALENASRFLGVDKDKIEIKLHKKGSSGFLGLGKKRPHVYWIYAIEGKTPLYAVVKGVLSTIISKLGFPAKIGRLKELEEGKRYIPITVEPAGILIGKEGKTLHALQRIVNTIVQRFLGEPPKILIDIDNYRERRKKYLERWAKKVAEEVKETKKTFYFPPLNSYERRIIHLIIQEYPNLKTEGEGKGSYKRLKVYYEEEASSEEEERSSSPHIIVVEEDSRKEEKS